MSVSITNTKDRRIAVSLRGKYIVIDQHDAYLPIGYQRRKWNTNGVALSREELELIVAKVRSGEIAK